MYRIFKCGLCAILQWPLVSIVLLSRMHDFTYFYFGYAVDLFRYTRGQGSMVSQEHNLLTVGRRNTLRSHHECLCT